MPSKIIGQIQNTLYFSNKQKLHRKRFMLSSKTAEDRLDLKKKLTFVCSKECKILAIDCFNAGLVISWELSCPTAAVLYKLFFIVALFWLEWSIFDYLLGVDWTQNIFFLQVDVKKLVLWQQNQFSNFSGERLGYINSCYVTYHCMAKLGDTEYNSKTVETLLRLLSTFSNLEKRNYTN